MESDHRLHSKGKQLLGFIALSRQIMQAANKGNPRVEFLQDLSMLLLQFSDCAALELRIRGNIEYRWRAVCRPERSFDYQPLQIDDNRGDSAESIGREPLDLRRVVQDELQGKLDPAAPCFTAYGSFWTGDVEATVAQHSLRNGIHLAIYPGTISLALIPIPIDTDNVGVLRLECERQDAFALDAIESYEALGETLGLAIAQRRAQAALRERVKELTCLYNIAHVVEDSAGSVEKALARTVGHLPPAWQFPEVAVARVTVDGTEYATGDFGLARARQIAEIVVNGKRRGKVEVGYVEEVQSFANGPFLTEEEHLIVGVARKVGQFLERFEAADERLKLEAQLRHADRLATIGQLAAGVAHEINEPLGGILGFAQLAMKGDDLSESTASDLNKIIAACLRAREIVAKLRLFARQAPIQKTWVSAAEVLEEALALVETRCANLGIEIIRHIEADLPDIPADPVQLGQVMVNLVVNGVQAMPDGGRLSVSARRDDSTLVVEIEDSGLGMTEEVMERIFNPFFTTKDVGEGTGLGLCVVHGIVTSHRGTIGVESEVGRGSKFSVRFPLEVEPGDEVD